MCGITGYINLNGQPVSQTILENMTEALKHRGPDNSGIWKRGNVGLGHTRLTILDLSTLGNQPMVSRDGGVVLSYNGEIYNFRELRDELQKKGYSFVSTTDTEVLLYGFIEWGIEVVHKLNGMFAFVVYDVKKNSVYLARDRYGIKPLYYSFNNNTIAFASEIKSILKNPQISSHLSLQGLVEYCSFQNFFTEHTLFKDIFLLGAGQYLKIDLNACLQEGSINKTFVSYWDYNFVEPSICRTEESYLEELDVLFHQAVRRQLVSDVPVGSYLSGGMDSGAITAVSSRYLQNMPTFTCGFDIRSASDKELFFDERDAAELMSHLFGTVQYEMVLKSTDLERSLPQVAWSLEEPRVGQSYPNYCIANLASKFTKVVLSGAGGDELFGGYPWRYTTPSEASSFNSYVDNYYSYWNRLIPSEKAPKAFRPIWEEVKHINTKNIFKSIFPPQASKMTRREDYINHSLYFEAKTFLQGLLIVEDKLSMAHSLEARVPFLDNDLVDFAMQLPVKMKVKLMQKKQATGEHFSLNYEKNNNGKYLLRKMMERYVPKEVSSREKQGFSAPDASWFRKESRAYVERTILNPQAEIYNYLDFKEFCSLIGRHMSGEENHRLLIWSLLNLENTCRQYFPSQSLNAIA